MEPLQKEILALSDKVDAIYRVIEQMESKVSQALSDCSLAKMQAENSYSANGEPIRQQFKGNINFNPELEHKDILSDALYLDMNRQSGDKVLTPEIQIQRLTAQLTAAYNRIAALEEQLLRERIH